MTVVVVTGATGDAGREVCRTLLGPDFTVVAVGTDAARLESVDADLRLTADLADLSATCVLAERVREAVGPVDGVVHLVGGWRAGQADTDFDWLNDRILGTLRHVTLAFRDDLVASNAGRLVIVSSTSVVVPNWGNANYVTVKAASEAWMRALASGWSNAGTAAAFTLAVTSIGRTGTSPATIASAVEEVWSRRTADLNGTTERLDA